MTAAFSFNRNPLPRLLPEILGLAALAAGAYHALCLMETDLGFFLPIACP